MNKINLKVIVQFIKFGIVGVSNTLVSLLTYYIFIFAGSNYIFANFAGFILGTANAYFWNNRYVFKKEEDEERPHIKTGMKVFIAYGITFLLSTLFLVLWVDGLGISTKIAPIINVCVTTPINFLMNKLWVFNEKGKSNGN
jgi:putative flippase GtrA